MRKRQNKSFWVLVLCLMTSFTACTTDDALDDRTTWTTYTVGVILPGVSQPDSHWKRCIEMASKTMKFQQQGLEKGVQVRFEWYDEETINIEETVTDLLDRKDVHALIGPNSSEHVKTAMMLAQATRNTHKPLLTNASSEDLIRMFSSKSIGNLWAMSESDITQCELLLTIAAKEGGQHVALLARDDAYGSTFLNWFGFIAKELKLEVAGIYEYTDENLQTAVQQIGQSAADCVLMIPSSATDAVRMMQYNESLGLKEKLKGHIYFSDVAFSEGVLQRAGTDCSSFYNGVAMYEVPELGFSVQYKMEYDEIPMSGEAQYFDAVCLLYYALFDRMMRGDDGENLNLSLRRIVDGKDAPQINTENLKNNSNFYQFSQGIYPDISGFSGPLEFDTVVYTNVLKTVYAYWQSYREHFIIHSYVASEGSNRVSSGLANWNWKPTDEQHFESSADFPDAGVLDEKWALLVAGSYEWRDYRHQADILDIYHFLKDRGFDDDHIVLICEDNIAYHEKNLYPGVIRNRLQGPNLYEHVVIDYKPSMLSNNDLKKILLGEKTEQLTQVIESDSNDNVLVFWSGHGGTNIMYFGNQGEDMRSWQFRDMMSEVQQQGKYRKCLCLLETCYSGSMAFACVGIPDLLLITAANENEPSKTDVSDPEMGIWLSNRFTRLLTDQLKTSTDLSFVELYTKVFRGTIGSHVTVYNDGFFGNLYQEKLNTFFN